MTRPSRWVISEVSLAGSPPPATPRRPRSPPRREQASASGRPCWEPGWETQTPVSLFLQSRITPARGRAVGEIHLILVVLERRKVWSGEGAPGARQASSFGFPPLFPLCWGKLFLYWGDATGGGWGLEKPRAGGSQMKYQKDSTLD